MHAIKASLLVVTALAGLAGGAVLLRDPAPEQPQVSGGNVSELTESGAVPPSVAVLPVQPPEPPVDAAPDLEPDPEPDFAPDPDQAPPPLETPSVDIVRLEPDGSALVSGFAPGVVRLEVIIDGGAVWSGAPGPSGEFVAFVDLPRSDQAREMWLLAHAADGRTARSEGSVILAPSPALAGLIETPPAPDEDPVDPPPRPDLAQSAVPEVTASTPVAAPPLQPVAAPPVLALQSDAEGVRPLVSAPVPDTQGLALDTVRYGAEGEVILSGRAAADDRPLAIYLDGVQAAQSRTGTDGAWEAVLPQVPTGTYRLRADLSDASGRVAARVDLPFRREAPEVIEAARVAAQEADSTAALLTVQPGLTLWAIARDRYGDGFQYVAVYEANADQIADPDLIYPGQVLTLPE